MESRFLSFNGWTQILGVVFAGVAVLVGMAIGGYLIYAGKSQEGFGAMLTPLALVGSIFVGSKISQSKEKRRKQQTEDS